MIVVDTNVLVHDLNRDSPHHEACRGWLVTLRAGTRPWWLTWGIVYELVRVMTHRNSPGRRLDVEQVVDYLAALVEVPTAGVLVESERHLDTLATVAARTPIAGSRTHDGHTVALMQEHGIDRILTLDRDFLRFDQVRVVDPLQQPDD